MIRNLNELLRSYLNNQTDQEHYKKLWVIYHEAISNPPEGVIGVGAITYAEQKLVEAQMKSKEGSTDAVQDR